MSFNQEESDFISELSDYFRMIKLNIIPSKLITMHLKKSINNICKSNFSQTLLKFDSLFLSAFSDVFSYAKNHDLIDSYARDYSNRYNEQQFCNLVLNDTLKNHLNPDLYYFKFIQTGSYNSKNFDNYGLLLDPTRLFINEQKENYDLHGELELIYLKPLLKDLIQDILDCKKLFVIKADNLYINNQFSYMELAIKDHDLRELEPFKTYIKLKNQSFKSSLELVTMLQEGALFYKDLNSIGKAKPVKLKDLFSIDPFDLKETILDQDNFQLVDYSGKEIEAKKVNDLIKNLKFFKSDVINLARKNVQHSSIKM